MWTMEDNDILRAEFDDVPAVREYAELLKKVFG